MKKPFLLLLIPILLLTLSGCGLFKNAKVTTDKVPEATTTGPGVTLTPSPRIETQPENQESKPQTNTASPADQQGVNIEDEARIMINQFAAILKEGKDKEAALALCSIGYKNEFSVRWDMISSSDTQEIRNALTDALKNSKLVHENRYEKTYDITVVFPDGEETTDTMWVVLEPDGWKIRNW